MYWVAHESLSEVKQVYTTIPGIGLRWHLKQAFWKRCGWKKKAWEHTWTNLDPTFREVTIFFLSSASSFRYADKFLMTFWCRLPRESKVKMYVLQKSNMNVVFPMKEESTSRCHSAQSLPCHHHLHCSWKKVQILNWTFFSLYLFVDPNGRFANWLKVHHHR